MVRLVFHHLALKAGDEGRLHGERVGGGHEGVRHGVHVLGEVEHEGSEGRLVVVENLRGRSRWPVEGESVRVGHMPVGQCQQKRFQCTESTLKYSLPILLCMTKHAPE